MSEIIRVSRAFKSTVDAVSEKKRTVTAVITTDALDRYKEVVVPKGIRLNNYRANPVVLWSHRQDGVIGKNLWTKKHAGGRGLVACTLFAATDFAQEIFELYRDEFLNGWSIGALVDYKSYSPPTPDEIKARKELEACYRMIRGCELYEYSACAIPANPEALGNEVAKSIRRELFEEIEHAERWETITKAMEPATDPGPSEKKIELPPLVGKSFEQVHAEQRRTLEHLTSPLAARRAVAETLDRLRGSV